MYDMYKTVIAVTNRNLCQGSFLMQVEKIAKTGVKAIILREKDLPEQDYEALAEKVIKICDENRTQCILHSYLTVAEKLNCRNIHFPLPLLRENRNAVHLYQTIGVSIHSIWEAVEAEKLGATYLVAGHVFTTDCKKDLPGRGLDYIREISAAVTIPVYGIGGIHIENLQSVKEAGAAGVCMMSEFMKM